MHNIHIVITTIHQFAGAKLLLFFELTKFFNGNY